MTAYYNEIDPHAAQWLRNLIDAGHIPAGDVDERSIEDVSPDDLAGYTQCHFFAGIGIWAYALRLAGWPDDRPVWTGSCPCQPFSAAGKSAGVADERHLWPHWHYLISQRRPGVVFGEQVASKDGLGWLDLVQADLEGADYASGAVDLCAAGVGAPHIRQRLWFVAERMGKPGVEGLEGQRGGHRTKEGRQAAIRSVAEAGESGGPADAECQRVRGERPGTPRAEAAGVQGANGERQRVRFNDRSSGPSMADARPTGPTNGFWADADWLFCRDGKWRSVEPGTFPLAHGAPARVGRLRAYGNGIVAPAAKEVIEAYMESAERQGVA
ncbi:DNA cytosine methyltransferase [Guyparkeria halopsychrophila]|uniref:DNA cytosine methyltransferase n=1 Tax=Guyparkeria halopsychrophila TaxID=3139421 RepID=UPI0037CA83C2